MAETIPIKYAQSLMRLVPMAEEDLRAELVAMNLPLVLLESHGVADASIAVALNFPRQATYNIHQVICCKQDFQYYMDINWSALFEVNGLGERGGGE